MKLFKYGLPLAALAVLASCSNDKLDGPQENTPVSKEGTMYASFNIKMPAQSTRYDGNYDEDFDDGEDAEYAATSGYIILFTAADDENESNFTDDKAVFAQCQPLTSLAWNDVNGNENITTTSTTATAQFPELKLSGDEVYLGLVVLNPTNDFPISDEDLVAGTTTFGEWKIKAHQNNGNLKNGFVMTNAPEYQSEHTLVYVDKDEFAPSINEIDQPAATFYVQREVAKVTLANEVEDEDDPYFEVDVKETTQGYYDGDVVKFTGWNLDITNAYTYPVQNFDKAWLNRSNSATYGLMSRFYGADSNFQRIYWAIDPNYSDEDEDNGYAFLFPARGEDDEYNLMSVTKAAYCNENTFDVEHMLQNESTRVVFKGEYIIKDQDKAVDFLSYGKVRVAVPEDIYPMVDESASKIKLSELFRGYNEDGSVTEESDLETAMGLFAVTDPNIEVDYFKNGVVYYTAVIRHFSDDETDWSNYQPTFWDSSEYTNEQLGRYGVVRNNWYEINVNSVAGPGSPIIPEPGDDPDDPGDNEKYIDVLINILSWAKRSFDYDL